jgi:hypothetical protein
MDFIKSKQWFERLKGALPLGGMYLDRFEVRSTELLTCSSGAASFHKTFTLFPNLPKELRLDIWEMALPRRVVELKADAAILLNTEIDLPPIAILMPNCKAPNMLYVCRESRSVALNEYKLIQFPAFRHPAYISYKDDIMLVSGLWIKECIFSSAPGPWSWPLGCARRIAFDLRMEI